MKFNPRDFWGLKDIQVGDTVWFTDLIERTTISFGDYVGTPLEELGADIKHGYLSLHRDYFKEGGKVVQIVNYKGKPHYIVRYKDSEGKYVQLGFTEDKIERR